MKKKVAFTLVGVVVVAAIIALAIFALSGKDENSIETFNFEGTWKVAVYVSNETVSIVDNEYMVFDAENASNFRNSTSEPYVTSKYTVDNDKLILSDISREYTIDKITDHYVRIYEKQDTYMELIRYQNTDMSVINIVPNIMSGKWNIVYRNTDNVYTGDYLSFEDGIIGQYHAGSNEAIASSDYSINENHLIVDDWGKDMVIYPVTDNIVILVELTTDNGFIWELEKAEK